MLLFFVGLAFLLIGVFSLVKKRTLDNPFGFAWLIGAIVVLTIFFSPAWQDFMEVYPVIQENFKVDK